MRIISFTNRLVGLLPVIVLLSCHRDIVTLQVASIDLLLAKETNTIYTTHNSKSSNPIGPDSITYGNTTFYNGHIAQEVYEYDTLKRITRHRTVDIRRPNDTFLGTNMALDFKYSSDQTMSIYYSKSGTVELFTLTPAGFMLGSRTSRYTYDSNGYRIKDEHPYGRKYERTVLNGNVVQQIFTAYDAITKTSYQHDLTKPSLPSPYRILHGKQSQNLLMGTVETEGAYKKITTFSYEYDQQGLPKRRKAYIEWIDTAAKTTEKQVHITDFEYLN